MGTNYAHVKDFFQTIIVFSTGSISKGEQHISKILYFMAPTAVEETTGS